MKNKVFDIESGLPSEEQLLADLRKDFPNMHVRPLREFGISDVTYGAWVGGEEDCVMPDGLPVFDHLGVFEETHDGTVHVGFDAWLAERGWECEFYDTGVYFIVPMTSSGSIL